MVIEFDDDRIKWDNDHSGVAVYIRGATSFACSLCVRFTDKDPDLVKKYLQHVTMELIDNSVPYPEI